MFRHAIFAIFLLVIAAVPARAKDIIPSPDKKMRVETLYFDDDPAGTNCTHVARLYKGRTLLWKFVRRGRAMEFAWSPDSRFLLVNMWLEGRNADLYYVDTRAKVVKEHDLELGRVESIVSAALPYRNSEWADRSNVDFETIRWIKPGLCQLRYVFRTHHYSGDARLWLDLTKKPAGLKVIKIVSLPEHRE